MRTTRSSTMCASATKCQHVGGGEGPQVNKSEQVSNLGHQMLLAGGPSMAGWETGASPCMVGAL